MQKDAYVALLFFFLEENMLKGPEETRRIFAKVFCKKLWGKRLCGHFFKYSIVLFVSSEWPLRFFVQFCPPQTQSLKLQTCLMKYSSYRVFQEYLLNTDHCFPGTIP